MLSRNAQEIFTREVLNDLLPPQRSDEFFEALYGDPNEGAYDIRLAFKNYDADRQLLVFELQLHERPEKCLACNLTYGLPQVFSRHPLIDINGMVKNVEALLGQDTKCMEWALGNTQTPADNLHVIPLTIRLANPV